MKRPVSPVIASLIVTGCLVAAASAQAPKEPKFLVVKRVQESAGYVFKAKSPDAVLKQDMIDDYDYKSIAAVQERAAKCAKDLKALLDGGAMDSEEIEIGEMKLTLGALSEKILDINQQALQVGMIGELEQNALRTKVWVEDVGQKGKLDLSQLEVASDQGAKLEKAVLKAQKMGFPDTYKVAGFTLPELKEMGHYVFTAGGQLKKAIEAQRAAKDVPFLKVLKGDKLKVFKQEFGGQGGQWEASGSGGRLLATPEALNGASTWYTWSSSSGVLDVWHITGWRFEGDRLAGVYSKNGFGLKPPVAAFK